MAKKKKTSLKSMPPSDSSRDTTRETLLWAAKEIFGNSGYEGATVKEIADLAKVNVSLVSYHFKGKEGLYRACLEGFGNTALSILERVLRPAENLDEFGTRLQLFAEEFIIAHLKEKNICRILHRDFDASINPIAADVFRSSFLKVFTRLQEFLHAGQKVGFLRDDFDSKVSSVLLFGSLVHVIRVDALAVHLFGKSHSLENRSHFEKVVSHFVKQTVEGISRGQK